MKKAVLLIMLLINLVFIANFLIGIGFRLTNLWTVLLGAFFIISILFSGIFLFRSRKKPGYHPYLSLGVLTLSSGSFAWFIFLNYLSLLMG
ncbi:hypothetical protein VBD025_14925 [Virgibacillus flavescens]|uniref:hypothetical protein n=1 Tax=Virgibacillus flavescens TaxID=1611422 RepID=UPI003D32CBFF